MQNVLFYKFVEMNDLEEFQQQHQAFLDSLGVRGKVLIASEGINGNISGTQKQCEQYMKKLRSDERFADIEFKITPTDSHDFDKTIVRIRPETITLEHEYDYADTAPYIEPKELDALYESGEDFVILDTRNGYESRIGKFKGAITPDMDVFSEFPDLLKDYEHLKDKLIVTYCTGGIRCEKATAVMKAKGFSNVRQLHGGILRYGDKQGQGHWQGKCFVFDKRVDIDIADEPAQPITSCEITGKPTSHYINCANTLCDKRFLCSEQGSQQYDGCCSEHCQRRVQSRNEVSQS